MENIQVCEEKSLGLVQSILSTGRGGQFDMLVNKIPSVYSYSTVMTMIKAYL
jgi:hypothetical protein